MGEKGAAGDTGRQGRRQAGRQREGGKQSLPLVSCCVSHFVLHLVSRCLPPSLPLVSHCVFRACLPHWISPCLPLVSQCVKPLCLPLCLPPPLPLVSHLFCAVSSTSSPTLFPPCLPLFVFRAFPPCFPLWFVFHLVCPLCLPLCLPPCLPLCPPASHRVSHLAPIVSSTVSLSHCTPTCPPLCRPLCLFHLVPISFPISRSRERYPADFPPPLPRTWGGSLEPEMSLLVFGMWFPKCFLPAVWVSQLSPSGFPGCLPQLSVVSKMWPSTCLPLVSQLSPRCLPIVFHLSPSCCTDVVSLSQVPPRCHPDAISQMLSPSCLQGFSACCFRLPDVSQVWSLNCLVSKLSPGIVFHSFQLSPRIGPPIVSECLPLVSQLSFRCCLPLVTQPSRVCLADVVSRLSPECRPLLPHDSQLYCQMWSSKCLPITPSLALNLKPSLLLRWVQVPAARHTRHHQTPHARAKAQRRGLLGQKSPRRAK